MQQIWAQEEIVSLKHNWKKNMRQVNRDESHRTFLICPEKQPRQKSFNESSQLPESNEIKTRINLVSGERPL